MARPKSDAVEHLLDLYDALTVEQRDLFAFGLRQRERGRQNAGGSADDLPKDAQTKWPFGRPPSLLPKRGRPRKKQVAAPPPAPASE